MSAMRKPKKEKYVEPPEESIPLRVTNALIIVTCIIVACMYAELPLFQTFLYVWFAITGCYTSYYFRQGKQPWLTGCIIVGLLFVIYLFARDLFDEYTIGQLEKFSPFLAVIAGMQTVHAFDLQTRSDINVSTFLSLLLFTMTAVIARDLLFGFFVMGFVVLGSALLYFEAVARTKANQGSTQLSQAEVTLPFPTQSRRMASGSAMLPIAALPVVTIILFAALPRVDSIVDVLMAKFHPSPIKVDDKGFNFMSGTGKGPGKGKNGAGAGENNGAKKDEQDRSSQNNSSSVSGQKPNTGSSPGGTTNGTDKDGKAAKNSQSGKAGKETLDSKQGKESKESKVSKDGKTQKPGQGPGESGKDKNGKEENKEADKQNANAASSGGDKKSDKKNQNGTGSGKGKRHGDGLQGFGDSGEADSEDAAKKEKLQNTHLTESDELVFRDKTSADFDDSVFMTIRSDQPVFLKRNVFDHYDGKHWLATVKTKPASCEKSESGWTELGGVPQLFVPSEQKSKTVLQVITAEVGLGRIIPAASVPQRVDLSRKQSGAVSVDEYGVLRAEKNIEPGTVFKIESKIPIFDIKKMHESERDSAKEKEILAKETIYLQLPENLPPEIKKLTEEIVIADDNFFNRADRICKHLRTHYKYSSDVYKSEGSEDVVSNFLFKKKEGACGEFTSAFVIMCRQAGVPARCVGGYGPGTPDGRTGRREITGIDGHAWGEVCIPNVGWVPFDATPTGTMPEGPKQDDSWFSAIKHTFEQAESVFQSSQQDRNIGKGSEEDYKAAPQSTHSSESSGNSGSAKNEPGASTQSQPAQGEGQSGKDGKNEKDSGTPKSKIAPEDVSPLGRSTSEAEAEVLKPQEPGKSEKVENKSFVLSWQAIAFTVALIPFGWLVIRFGLARLRRRKQDVRSVHGISPSTTLYLKMTEDLKRLKVLRRPSDTPDELSRRFSELVESDERIHPELEGLFLDFIEIYAQERFSEEGHNAENYKQLKEIGNRIHTLSKTRLEKQRN